MAKLYYSSKLHALVLFAAILALTLNPQANAEVLKLKSGQIITGQIVERDRDTIKIKLGNGIAVTYFLDEIDFIDNESIESFVASYAEENALKEAIGLEQAFSPPEVSQESSNKPAPIKDIAVIEEQGRSKEIASPFGPTIREMDATADEKGDGSASDSRNNVTSYLMDRVYQEQGVQAVREPLARGNGESRNVIIRNFNLFFGQQKEILDGCSISIIKYVFINQENFRRLPEKVRQDIFIFGSIAFLVIYVLSCYPMMKIAKTMGRKHSWLIWIPVVQLIYFIHMAEKSLLWIIPLLIPIINVIALIELFGSILVELRKSPWIALCILLPVINIIMLWFIAFYKPNAAVNWD